MLITNADRAERATFAVEAYGNHYDATMLETEGYEYFVGSLLADLMHFCDKHGIDFHSKLDIASLYYQEEVGEELEVTESHPPFHVQMRNAGYGGEPSAEEDDF